jgi:uncharacterized protein YndB with AHSA1/START domain
MTHPFELTEEIDLDATPDQVWAAIASGPGIDSWFMGRSEIAGHEGGRNQMSLMGFTNESTTTAWEPGRRFAYRSDDAPDGTFMAFEYLIEGRAGGSTHLRYVHSGMLGDDWAAEYDGLRKGTRMYLLMLATYLRHFEGRTATSTMFLPGPQVADAQRVWTEFIEAFGVTGDRARLQIDGLDPVDGTVDFASEPTYLEVRTANGLYSLIHGYRDTVVVQYHGFSGGSAEPVDDKAIESAWQGWLATAFEVDFPENNTTWRP